MRKLFWLTVAVISGAGGVYIARPDWVSAQWRRGLALAGKQIEAELSTLDQLKSGQMRPGASAGPKDTKPKASVSLPAVKAKAAKTQNKTPNSEGVPSRNIVSPSPAPAISPPLKPSSAKAAPEATPEVKLGNILTHENRPEQMKQETFWTEERIQEALKNGPPKSGSAPCIAFCDQKNTVIEINTPD